MWGGRIVDRLLVRPDIEGIFEYRRAVLREISGRPILEPASMVRFRRTVASDQGASNADGVVHGLLSRA